MDTRRRRRDVVRQERGRMWADGEGVGILSLGRGRTRCTRGRPTLETGGAASCTLVQSQAVATQHLRPAGLGHVNPTTASAWPELPALPCGEQSNHHVTRTSEATEHMAEGRSELLHPAQILHSPAHWVGRAGRVHIERPETGVAQRDRIRRAPPPARFSSAVNAERHAMQ